MALEKQLTSAAWSGDLAATKALLKEDPEAARHWQPIMTAAFTGSTEIVRLLVEHGADPNVISRNNHRHRPLHRVLEHKKTIPKGPHHVETVRVLLELGARVDLRGGHGRMTAPCLAAVGGEIQFLPVLREYIEAWDIFTCVALGEADRVRSLLDGDESLAGAVDENRWRPLNYAAASGAGRDDGSVAARLEAIVVLLLQRGAEVNRPPPPLTSAIGNPAMMRVLREKMKRKQTRVCVETVSIRRQALSSRGWTTRIGSQIQCVTRHTGAMAPFAPKGQSYQSKSTGLSTPTRNELTSGREGQVALASYFGDLHVPLDAVTDARRGGLHGIAGEVGVSGGRLHQSVTE